MAGGHGASATIGGAVIGLGAFPGGLGAYETVGSGRSPFRNLWFNLGAALWLVGLAIVVVTSIHMFLSWRSAKTKTVGFGVPISTINIGGDRGAGGGGGGPGGMGGRGGDGGGWLGGKGGDGGGGASLQVPQEPFQSEGAKNELRVTLLSEDPHPFQHKALLQLIHYNVENLTNRQIQITGGPVVTWDDHGQTHLMGDMEVEQERYRLTKYRQDRLPGVIDAGGTVDAWFCLVLPHLAKGGEPGYDFWVEDYAHHKYGVKRPFRSA